MAFIDAGMLMWIVLFFMVSPQRRKDRKEENISSPASPKGRERNRWGDTSIEIDI
jgi:hypothetical protein